MSSSAMVRSPLGNLAFLGLTETVASKPNCPARIEPATPLLRPIVMRWSKWKASRLIAPLNDSMSFSTAGKRILYLALRLKKRRPAAVALDRTPITKLMTR